MLALVGFSVHYFKKKSIPLQNNIWAALWVYGDINMKEELEWTAFELLR